MLGEKIKELRHQNGLTLEELANRSELTKGFLSQVERNLTSPSIQTFLDILEVLGTTPEAFFKSLNQETKNVFTNEDYYEVESDHFKVEWIVPNAQKNEMEPIIITINPNSSSFVIKPHEGEEFGYVLSGCVTLKYGEKDEFVKKGETFYIKGKHQHQLLNHTKKVAKILWISTPPLF